MTAKICGLQVADSFIINTGNGTNGEILAETDRLMLVRNSVSNDYMLACEDMETSLSLLDRFVGWDCKLLMVSNDALGKAAFER
ncbi:MAG: hypothetical protein II885_15650 [Oscillospiraceae bacterium]|nr:hypothetical protein [Oscillospiraceae bacterium]MBQ3704168.1 hypothetical protein [Oscillospiraceae bacterium]